MPKTKKKSTFTPMMMTNAGGKKEIGEQAKTVTVSDIVVRPATADATVEDIDVKKKTEIVAFIVNAVLRGSITDPDQ